MDCFGCCSFLLHIIVSRVWRVLWSLNGGWHYIEENTLSVKRQGEIGKCKSWKKVNMRRTLSTRFYLLVFFLLLGVRHGGNGLYA